MQRKAMISPHRPDAISCMVRSQRSKGDHGSSSYMQAMHIQLPAQLGGLLLPKRRFNDDAMQAHVCRCEIAPFDAPGVFG